MEQQTAVEWFIEQLFKNNIIPPNFNPNNILFSQARKMNKEQIIKAWDDGDYAYFYSKETGIDFDNGEQYYNETYNKQTTNEHN